MGRERWGGGEDCGRGRLWEGKIVGGRVVWEERCLRDGGVWEGRSVGREKPQDSATLSSPSPPQAITLPPLAKWPSQSGFSFSTWIRIEKTIEFQREYYKPVVYWFVT